VSSTPISQQTLKVDDRLMIGSAAAQQSVVVLATAIPALL
jgi:hypothetical protein